jgi:hypothetical protein
MMRKALSAQGLNGRLVEQIAAPTARRCGAAVHGEAGVGDGGRG